MALAPGDSDVGLWAWCSATRITGIDRMTRYVGAPSDCALPYDRCRSDPRATENGERPRMNEEARHGPQIVAGMVTHSGKV